MSGTRDRGSATIYGLAITLVLAVVTVAALVVAEVIVARHRADSAADLAALSAAGVVGHGASEACAVARKVASAQGANVAACQVRGQIVEVIVTVETRSMIGLLPPVRGRARAGPTALP